MCIALLLAEKCGEFVKFVIFAACEGGPLVTLHAFPCSLLMNLMDFPHLSYLLNLPYLRLLWSCSIHCLIACWRIGQICHACHICQICHIHFLQRPYCLLMNLIDFAKFVIACISGHISLTSCGIYLLYLSHFAMRCKRSFFWERKDKKIIGSL